MQRNVTVIKNWPFYVTYKGKYIKKYPYNKKNQKTSTWDRVHQIPLKIFVVIYFNLAQTLRVFFMKKTKN